MEPLPSSTPIAVLFMQPSESLVVWSVQWVVRRPLVVSICISISKHRASHQIAIKLADLVSRNLLPIHRLEVHCECGDSASGVGEFKSANLRDPCSINQRLLHNRLIVRSEKVDGDGWKLTISRSDSRGAPVSLKEGAACDVRIQACCLPVKAGPSQVSTDIGIYRHGVILSHVNGRRNRNLVCPILNVFKVHCPFRKGERLTIHLHSLQCRVN